MGGVPDEVGALEPAAEVCILGVPIGSFFWLFSELHVLPIANPILQRYDLMAENRQRNTTSVMHNVLPEANHMIVDRITREMVKNG